MVDRRRAENYLLLGHLPNGEGNRLVLCCSLEFNQAREGKIRSQYHHQLPDVRAVLDGRTGGARVLPYARKSRVPVPVQTLPTPTFPPSLMRRNRGSRAERSPLCLEPPHFFGK